MAEIKRKRSRCQVCTKVFSEKQVERLIKKDREKIIATLFPVITSEENFQTDLIRDLIRNLSIEL